MYDYEAVTSFSQFIHQHLILCNIELKEGFEGLRKWWLDSCIILKSREDLAATTSSHMPVSYDFKGTIEIILCNLTFPSARLLGWKHRTTFLPPSSARSKSNSEEEWKGSPAKHGNVTSPRSAQPQCKNVHKYLKLEVFKRGDNIVEKKSNMQKKISSTTPVWACVYSHRGL